MRFLALTLFTVVATQAAFATSASNYFSQVPFPVIEPHLHLLPVSIEPRLPRQTPRTTRSIGIVCGWEVSNPIPVEPRPTKLPVDPVLVLANGYLKCKSIRTALFDPQVSVADYPAGYFGDDEYAGLLVPAWIEFSDETGLRKIFHTVASLADGPDDLVFFYYEMEGPPLTLEGYRHASRFSPELVIEFVGGTDVRIELNLTQGRMLVQADTRWDFYHLNQHQAGLLMEIITAGKNNPAVM